LNDECGRVSDVLFGQSKITTTADPAILNGWQHRGYNWQASARIDQQLMGGVAVTAGYYRTWYGNFTVTDNLAVSPANYDPYCITLPVDARLPGGGGNQVCGLYDLNPSKVGQVNNFVTFASNYGKQTEVYNGGDINLTARLPRGAQFSGGLNVGNSVNGGAVSGASAGISHINNCDVVPKLDNPSTRFCDAAPKYQARFKMYGTYPLPWDFQISGTFNSLPGVSMLNGNNITANIVLTNAQIAASLGRTLASGSTATIALIQPFTQFEDRLNQLDLRLSKIITVGRRTRIQANFDLYNATNANPVVVANWNYSGNGATYLQPQQILDARLFKFSGQITF